jgi:hypothetical protein
MLQLVATAVADVAAVADVVRGSSERVLWQLQPLKDVSPSTTAVSPSTMAFITPFKK